MVSQPIKLKFKPLKSLRSQGLAIYLGSFIPNFADLVDPLWKLFKKRTKLGMGWSTKLCLYVTERKPNKYEDNNLLVII